MREEFPTFLTKSFGTHLESAHDSALITFDGGGDCRGVVRSVFT